MLGQTNADNGVFPLVPPKSKASANYLIDRGMGKLPPQAIEMEEAVIGAVLLEPCFEDLRAILGPDDFYKEANQRVWNACEVLQKKGEPIDLLTVTTQLRSLGELETVGGAHYVTSLTAKVNSSANSEFYARVVSQASMRRKLINWSSEIHRRCYEDTEDVFDIFSDASNGLTQIEDGKLTGKDVSIINQTDRAIYRLRHGKLIEQGILSSFAEVRDVVPCFEYGSLNVIAARPSVGKSLYMINEAIGICEAFHIPTLVISLEMSDLQQVDRALSMLSGVDSERMKKKILTEDELKLLEEAGEFLKRFPLFINDNPSMNIVEIILMIHKYVHKHGVKNVYIDYLQLIGASESKNSGNRNLEVGEMCRLLKITAMKLGISITILSQLNRDTKDGMPKLYQLRDSGEIEAHIDTCLFLYRPEMAGIEKDEFGNSTAGVILLDFAKNRFGRLDTIEMFFSGAKSRIMSRQPRISSLPTIPQKGGIVSQL